MDVPTNRYELIDGTIQPIGLQQIGFQPIIIIIQQVIDPTSTSTTIETSSIQTLSLLR